jgi:hypothetical protein
MKRVVLAAAAALVSLAAGCGTTAGGGPPTPAPAATAGFIGYKWSVVAIGHDGRETPIPARYNVYLQFTPSGQFGANDPVNYHSGTYRVTSDGFTTSDVVTTLVGYAGKDPVTLLAMSAISSFDANPSAAVRNPTGSTITIGVNGYTLTCERAGKQANFPAPAHT